MHCKSLTEVHVKAKVQWKVPFENKAYGEANLVHLLSCNLRKECMISALQA